MYDSTKTTSTQSSVINSIKTNTHKGCVGFEERAVLIEAGQMLDSIDNPSGNRKGQKAFVLDVNDYVYLVPYVENEEEIFLKTLYPSRKFTAIYLGQEKL